MAATCGEIDYRKQAQFMSNMNFKTKRPQFQSVLVDING